MKMKAKSAMLKLINFLKEVYYNCSIRRKFIMLLCIQIIVPIVLMGYTAYRKSAQIFQAEVYSQDVLRMIELRLNDYIQNINLMSKDLLYNQNVYEVLSSHNWSYDPLVYYENEEKISNALKQFLVSKDEFEAVCLVSADGKFYTVARDPNKTNMRLILPYKEVLNKAMAENGREVWYFDESGTSVNNIFIARVIYDKDRFNEIGLMAILLDKNFLAKEYDDLRGQFMQNIAILSPSNKEIIGRNSTDKNIYNSDAIKRIKNGRESFVDDKTEMFVSYIAMATPGWKIVSYTPLDILYSDINDLRKLFVLLSAMTIIIVFMLSVYMSSDLIKPINDIVEAMTKVRNGDTTANVSITRGDELGFLANSFNDMTSSMDYLIKQIYMEQITRKDAQLKALQSQINPHFLFNTLDYINWMARINHVDEMTEAVSNLSKLMEASIGKGDRFITVKEEFNYIDYYASIIKLRFEGKIEVVKDVQFETLKIKIPRLLIQPLVENAVYHGIEKSVNKGIITLKAYISGVCLVIEVIDNGVGIDKDDLDILNDMLSMDNETYFKRFNENGNKSIGIENVNRRIKLLYGEDYGLSIWSRRGEGTKVIVRIPIDQTHEEETYV